MLATARRSKACSSKFAKLCADAATHADLARLLKPGAALNALDCAFWDLESKRTGRSAVVLAGLARTDRAR